MVSRRISLEKDSPLRVADVLQNNDDPRSLYIEIEWKTRKNGIKPKNSTYTNKRLREKFPNFLLDFYEDSFRKNLLRIYSSLLRYVCRVQYYVWHNPVVFHRTCKSFRQVLRHSAEYRQDLPGNSQKLLCFCVPVACAPLWW